MARTLPGQLFTLATGAESAREALRLIYSDRDEIVLSRKEVYLAAQRTAEQLAALGVGAGDLVIIVQQDSLLLTASFFGAALLGAIPSIMPFASEKLHPDRYRNAMSALIKLSEPAVLATDPAVEDDARAILPEEGEGIHLPQILVLTPESVLGNSDEPRLDGTFDPDVVALLQHSSGTTGLQKGVALAHRAIFEQLDQYSKSLDFTTDDVIVSWLPLYHDMGLIAGFLMPLLTGARLVLMSPFDWVRAPHMLLQAITAQGGTLTWLPNFTYNFCAQKIRDENLEGVDLSSMRAFINCSEPIYDNSHRLFAERFEPYGAGIEKLATCYAMAETVFGVTQSKIGEPARVEWLDRKALREDLQAVPVEPDYENVESAVSSGKPIGGMNVRVLDPDRNPLPERRIGEIALNCSYMLTEYHRRPDATEEAFHEGWYLTGDMGYVADGEVFVLGRKKDLIIVGGKNVYPRDIEMLVSKVDGIHPGRVVAFGAPNVGAGTEDVAVIAEIDDFDMPDEEKSLLKANVRRKVAAGSDVAVRYVELVPRGWLVKTSSGKVSRSANRLKFLDEKGL
ncbi:MAG: AMP-binding protein [Anaerolineae bacterium]|nr:AMP-binding protein [Anaerolineae bacterium]